jgi:thiol-disulfide isomerase/thioredoxin
MKKAVLVDIITYFFILLFIYTGVAKLTEMPLVREQMISAPFLGAFAGFISWGLPIGEILLAIALFLPVLRLKALYVTLALMTTFTVYVVVILFMDNHLACSCGGIIEELSPRQHVLFNSACVALSTVAIVVERRQQPTSNFSWMTGTSTIGLFAVVGWMLFTAFTSPARVKTGMEGRLLPPLDFFMVDSVTHFNTAQIPTGQPFIVIGFSPWCTHCQAETRDILKHMQLFRNTNIYYVTPYPFWQMKQFYTYFRLAKYPNIAMGSDSLNHFLTYFNAPGAPYTAVFDANKRLKVVFTSQVDATKLAQVLTD